MKYLAHWALLVEGITILLCNSISTEMLQHAEIVLAQFVLEMEELYGRCYMSFNVHLCLHLCRSVKNWGPLWTHSAFVFESYNSDLISMFKGTQAVPLQICKNFALHRALPMLTKQVLDQNCEPQYVSILKSSAGGPLPVKNATIINGVTVLGRPKVT